MVPKCLKGKEGPNFPHYAERRQSLSMYFFIFLLLFFFNLQHHGNMVPRSLKGKKGRNFPPLRRETPVSLDVFLSDLEKIWIANFLARHFWSPYPDWKFFYNLTSLGIM